MYMNFFLKHQLLMSNENRLESIFVAILKCFV